MLKAITKNPPMVALASELQTEPEELIEHNNHDENEESILNNENISVQSNKSNEDEIVYEQETTNSNLEMTDEL